MPAPYSLNDFASAIPSVLQDSANKLYPATGSATTLVQVLTPFIQRAFERYSKDAPLLVVSDSESTGSTDLELPVDPDGKGVYDVDFSQVQGIEWPVDQLPPEYIDPTDFLVYRKPSGNVLRLTADTPGAGDVLRVTWTARHATDGSTIPDRDFAAVVDFAAALAAEQLATIYAQTSDPVFQADVVNYRSKSQEYQSIAKMLRKRYYNHLGIDEGDKGSAEVKPAFAVGQQYLDMQSGVERLIHRKNTR